MTLILSSEAADAPAMKAHLKMPLASHGMRVRFVVAALVVDVARHGRPEYLPGLDPEQKS